VKTRSLAQKFGIWLVLVTLFVMIVFGVINYFLFINQLDKDLNARLDESASKVIDLLALHVWNLDNQGVQDVAQEQAFLGSFARLRVFNSFGDLIYETEEPHEVGEQEGEADAILVASFNQERTEFLHYTEKEQAYVIGGGEGFPNTSVGSAEISFFVRTLNEESLAFDSLDELVEDQRRVGVPATYSYVPAVKRLGFNVIEYITPEEGFEKLANGEADMFLIEKAVGAVLLKKMGLDEEIVYSASYSHIPLYMPFSKKSDYPNVDEVRIKIAEEIKKIHESGEYERIYNSYIQ